MSFMSYPQKPHSVTSIISYCLHGSTMFNMEEGIQKGMNTWRPENWGHLEAGYYSAYICLSILSIIYLSICLSETMLFIPIPSNSTQHHRIHSSFCLFCDGEKADSHFSLYSQYIYLFDQFCM